MSQWDKLIKRLYTIPDDMRFEELKKFLSAMDTRITTRVEEAATTHFENQAALRSRFLHIYPSRKSMSVW